MRHRPERVANLIKEELSKIIVRELEFPDCLVTITDIEVDNKLEQAIAKFSVFPSEKFEMVLKILEKNRGYLRHLLMKKINIKPMPKIVFRPDYGLEKAAGIEKILLENKIKK